MYQNAPAISFLTLPIERAQLTEELVKAIIATVEAETNGTGKVTQIFYEKLTITLQVNFESHYALRMNGIGIAEHTRHMMDCMRTPEDYIQELRVAERCAKEAEDRFYAKILRLAE